MEHSVPLGDGALSILQGITRRGDRDFVFGVRGGGFSDWSRSKIALDKAVALKEDWRLHDLRRTVRTGLGKLGIQERSQHLRGREKRRPREMGGAPKAGRGPSNRGQCDSHQGAATLAPGPSRKPHAVPNKFNAAFFEKARDDDVLPGFRRRCLLARAGSMRTGFAEARDY